MLLSEDLFALDLSLDPKADLDTRVELSIVGGEIVHTAG